MSDNFTCENCKKTFEKKWSDDEAQKEAEKNGWGNLPKDEIAVVCDDCYNLLICFVDM
jgi:hypothetical protein